MTIFNRKDRNYYRINEQGSILFGTEKEHMKGMYGADSFFDHPAMAYFIMLICAAVDMALFKQLFNSFLYDSTVIQCVSIVGLLFGFDFVPIYLGMNLKKLRQGYKVNKPVQIYAPAIAFTIAFVLSVVLRLYLKDDILSSSAWETTSTIGDYTNEETTNPRSGIYAAFTAALPLVTSVGSFAISYTLSNPLRAEERRLTKMKFALEDDLRITNSILREYDSDNYFERMTTEDNARLSMAQEQVLDRLAYYCDYVRQKIAEHLADPAANSALSEGAYKQIVARLDDISSVANTGNLTQLPLEG